MTHCYLYSSQMTYEAAAAILLPKVAEGIMAQQNVERILFLAQAIGDAWERHSKFYSVGFANYAREQGLRAEAYQTLLEIAALEGLAIW